MTTSPKLRCRNCGKEIVKSTRYTPHYWHKSGNWITCYPDRGFSSRAEPFNFNDYLKAIENEESIH